MRQTGVIWSERDRRGKKTGLSPQYVCKALYIGIMNYLLAILLPPLSILLTGRPIVAVLVFIIWIPALIFSGGLTHPMFIILAWALIFHAREDRRHRRDLS